MKYILLSILSDLLLKKKAMYYENNHNNHNNNNNSNNNVWPMYKGINNKTPKMLDSQDIGNLFISFF